MAQQVLPRIYAIVVRKEPTLILTNVQALKATPLASRTEQPADTSCLASVGQGLEFEFFSEGVLTQEGQSGLGWDTLYGHRLLRSTGYVSFIYAAAPTAIDLGQRSRSTALRHSLRNDCSELLS